MLLRGHQAIFQGSQRRSMATNPNDIKKRIKGTQAIKKITKSMQMVSAAKLKGDELRMKKGIVFGRSMLSLFPEKSYTSEEPAPEVSAKKPLIAVISSDKGLCGGINSFATKMTKLVHEQHQKALGSPPAVLIFGGKSEGQLRRTHGSYLVAVIDECWKQPMNFAVASGMATEMMNAAKKTEADQISLIFNSYRSKIKYDTTCQRIPNMFFQFSKNDEVPAPLDQYELEPDTNNDIIQNLYEFSVATTLFGACLDNATSEQSSRMQAMDNATKNAGEMINKLTLEYNRARQSKITTELIEIISGAESLKG